MDNIDVNDNNMKYSKTNTNIAITVTIILQILSIIMIDYIVK